MFQLRPVLTEAPSPQANAIFDVSQPGLHLARVPGLHHVVYGILYLWGQGYTSTTSGPHCCARAKARCTHREVPTCSRNVFSLSGTSRAVVLLTSRIEEQGTVTLGFEALGRWGQQRGGKTSF